MDGPFRLIVSICTGSNKYRYRPPIVHSVDRPRPNWAEPSSCEEGFHVTAAQILPGLHLRFCFNMENFFFPEDGFDFEDISFSHSTICCMLGAQILKKSFMKLNMDHCWLSSCCCFLKTIVNYTPRHHSAWWQSWSSRLREHSRLFGSSVQKYTCLKNVNMFASSLGIATHIIKVLIFMQRTKKCIFVFPGKRDPLWMNTIVYGWMSDGNLHVKRSSFHSRRWFIALPNSQCLFGLATWCCVLSRKSSGWTAGQ